VERDRVLIRDQVKAGDVVLGLASSGVHSNGYSLVRRVVERSGLAWDAPAPFDGERALGDALLAPTRIYVKPCLAAVLTGGVSGLVHVTGGGLVENPPRIFGDDLAMRLDLRTWTPPAVFGWLAQTGGIEGREMLRTFNCGLGMLVVARANAVDAVELALREHGEAPIRVGSIEARSGDGVVFDGLDQTWLA
jgi:phosphoribosylformylglycinamidine cyclo-ligase